MCTCVVAQFLLCSLLCQFHVFPFLGSKHLLELKATSSREPALDCFGSLSICGMLPCHVSVVVLLCGLVSAAPELPQPEKSGADAAGSLNASIASNSASGLKSSWPHPGCCNGCNSAFCSPQSGTCYNIKGKYYYLQCGAGPSPAASCCNGCNTAFCSPQSGSCYNHKGKYYYLQCEAEPEPSAAPCCRYCATEFCHFVTGNCYETRDTIDESSAARYLERCFSRATRSFGLRGSKSMPTSMLKTTPKVEIEDVAEKVAEEAINSSFINGTEDSLARSAGYYPRHVAWNCWNPSTMHSSDGYMGRTSVSGCRAMCDRRSWCVGFVYMRCQSKCWLREEGTSCSHASKGEAACFDYYGFLN